MNGPPIEPFAVHVPDRWRRYFDAGLPLVVWVLTTFSLFPWGPHHVHSQPWTAFLLVTVSSWSLWFRGSHPRAMIACVVAAALLRGAVPGMPQSTSLPLAIGLISFASRRPFREALVAALAAFAALALADVIAGGEHSVVATVASRLLFSVGVTALGLFIGSRRAYADQLRARARDLERERELLAERAVDEERVRIARELHDAIAHHVSLLVVQAGAIRESLPANSPTHELADSMADTGRQALDEMRSMLGVLRTGSSGAELAPQPGVADIRALVEQARRAEVNTDLVVEGSERPLPVGIDLSAYRIVQESLTNVVKHAGPATGAHVRVRYLPDALELEVTDDGPGPVNGSASAEQGHGIVGMRERVALYRGELDVGPAADGGWRVRARLPLEPQP